MSEDIESTLFNKVTEQRKQLHGVNKAYKRARLKIEQLELKNRLLAEENEDLQGADKDALLAELQQSVDHVRAVSSAMEGATKAVNTEMAHDVIKAAKRWAAGKTEDELSGERELALFQAVGWLK